MIHCFHRCLCASDASRLYLERSSSISFHLQTSILICFLPVFSIAFGFTTACCLLSGFFGEHSFLSHFSLSKNTTRIYEYNPNDSKARSTDYLHGLKALLCFSSIALHTFIGIGGFQSPLLYGRCTFELRKRPRNAANLSISTFPVRAPSNIRLSS